MADYYSLSLPVASLPPAEKSPLLVLPASLMAMRRRVERFGRYFRRELHTDFPPFEATEVPGVHGCIPYEAYIFFEDASDLRDGDMPLQSRFIGAACFRWQEWSNAPAGWSFDWVWFHPFFRQRGHLSRAWPIFEQRYGDFHITRALSCGMEKFLAKRHAAT